MRSELNFCVGLILFVLFVGVAPGAAQTAASGRIEPSFRAFYTKFRSAVEKGDKARVASMTKFPFEYGFDAGDEGTMQRSEFIKRFNELFGDAPKNFFKDEKPSVSRTKNGGYQASTVNASHLIFAKYGRTFRFTGFIVEP